jgi:hypothetical protein
MLMARLNNDRSPKLHKEVHCTLIVRESTIKCAAKVRGGNALDARASLPAKPFGGLRSNGTERLLPGKQSGYYPEARIERTCKFMLKSQMQSTCPELSTPRRAFTAR